MADRRDPEGRAADRARGRAAWLVRVAAYVISAAAMVQVVKRIDLQGTAAIVATAGPGLAVVLLPFACVVTLEAASWRQLLAALGSRVGWYAALQTTLSCEAIRLAFPGGGAAGDALRPALYRRNGDVLLTDSTAALAVRKICHVASQGAYVALGALLGAPLLAALGRERGAILATACFVIAIALVTLAGALALTLFHGSAATRIEQALTRWTGGRLAHILERRREEFAAVDARLRSLLGSHPRLIAWNLGTALIVWLLDAVESWLLLRILGAPIPLGEAIALEAIVAVARTVAFAVPGGLGVQEFGYLMLLVPVAGQPATAAFMVLKRVRDALWAGAGFLWAAVGVAHSGHGRRSCAATRTSIEHAAWDRPV